MAFGYLRALRDRRYVAILLTGFSSGLPLLLVGGTLRYWLADSGVDLGTIGAFALVSLPYALKFLWAPVLDRLPLPYLTARFGRRRSWGVLIQLCLAGALLALGSSDPRPDPQITAMLAVLVAFLSASQDVVIDAFRIEMLEPSEYALGGAISALGYRIGMLAAGAGALYTAQASDWHIAYYAVSGLIVFGVAGFFSAPDISAPCKVRDTGWLKAAFLEPLADFMTRHRWMPICLFIILYKLAPVLALGLTSPFYKDMGFSKAEIASVTKLFGLAATLFGGFAGAWLVSRIGLWRSLLWCGIAQALALFGFFWLSRLGHSLPVLVVAIGGENVTGAMAGTAFGTYIAALCNKRFTATQFALLTALAALTGDSLSAGTGVLAKHIGWPGFFMLMPLTALPGLAVLWKLKENTRHLETSYE